MQWRELNTWADPAVFRSGRFWLALTCKEQKLQIWSYFKSRSLTYIKNRVINGY